MVSTCVWPEYRSIYSSVPFSVLSVLLIEFLIAAKGIIPLYRIAWFICFQL